MKNLKNHQRQSAMRSICVNQRSLFVGYRRTAVRGVFHPLENGEDGYTLKFFNALGETIAVVTMGESAIRPLTEDDIWSVRQRRSQALQPMSLAEPKPIYKTDG